jgi:hypothetical protein
LGYVFGLKGIFDFVPSTSVEKTKTKGQKPKTVFVRL